MKILISLVVVMTTVGVVQSYSCPTTSLNTSMGQITSPGFPGPFPDGPYNCTYIITNPYGGELLLQFTDFVTNEMMSYGYMCREKIVIYERNGTGYDSISAEYCGDYLPTFHSSSTSTYVIRFEVTGHNIYQVPGFKAKFWAKEDSPFVLDRINYQGYIYFYNDAYQRGYSIGYHQRYDKISVYVNVIKAAPDHQVSFAPEVVPDPDITKEIHLEVRDGLTSEAPLLYNVTDLSDAKTAFSTSGFLHITVTMLDAYLYSVESYASFIHSPGSCPSGYYKCSNSGICIGTSAVCDGYNHCGDNSDEVHPSINCSISRSCESGFPYICEAGASGICYDGVDSYNCPCNTGYKGFNCEYYVEGCPQPCQNGGTCRNYFCNCAFGYYGDFCEEKKECVPPCENGGTCSVLFFDTCYCPPDYYGDRCENKYDYDSSDSNLLIYVFVPLGVTFVLFIGCFICLKRARFWKQQPNTYATTTISAVPDSVSYSRDQTSPAVYTDTPPSYSDAVTVNASETDGPSKDDAKEEDQLNPPPTYETVVL